MNFDFKYSEDTNDKSYKSIRNKRNTDDSYTDNMNGRKIRNHNQNENGEDIFEGKEFNNRNTSYSNRNIDGDVINRKNGLFEDNDNSQRSNSYSNLNEGNNENDDDEFEKPDEKKLQPLHKSILAEYSLSISIFTEFVIKSLFSLRFQYKEWAIKYIIQQLKENYNEWNKDGKSSNSGNLKSKQEYIIASIQVLKYSITDTREKIAFVSMDLLLLISCKLQKKRKKILINNLYNISNNY